MRISRERMYMDVAQAFARRSTCFRNNVGAVIVTVPEQMINGTGYNGPPSGEEHCRGNDCELTRTGGCLRSIHAEINALDRMSYPIMGEQWLFTTRSPCLTCAEMIRDSGAIQRVYFEEEYRRSDPIEILYNANIPVFRVTPSGYVVRWEGGRVQVENT